MALRENTVKIGNSALDKPDHDLHLEWIYKRAAIGAKLAWAQEMERDAELLQYRRDHEVCLLDPDEGPIKLFPFPRLPGAKGSGRG